MYSAARTTMANKVNASVMATPLSVGSSPSLKPAFRSPRRVTITLPFATFQELQERADGEGRSLSNLAAFLLESSLQSAGLNQGGAEVHSRQAKFH
jgi:hypothetical protein